MMPAQAHCASAVRVFLFVAYGFLLGKCCNGLCIDPARPPSFVLRYPMCGVLLRPSGNLAPWKLVHCGIPWSDLSSDEDREFLSPNRPRAEFGPDLAHTAWHVAWRVRPAFP